MTIIAMNIHPPSIGGFYVTIVIGGNCLKQNNHLKFSCFCDIFSLIYSVARTCPSLLWVLSPERQYGQTMGEYIQFVFRSILCSVGIPCGIAEDNLAHGWMPANKVSTPISRTIHHIADSDKHPPAFNRWVLCRYCYWG